MALKPALSRSIDATTRAPGIARQLYLTPGTVRNHLSSAFHKFGVTSQQELLDVLRNGGEPRR